MAISRLIAAILIGWSTARAQPMQGFSTHSAAEQSKTEGKLKKLVSTSEIRKFHRLFTAEPHPSGSERNNELARYVADTWKRQGWEDVKIHQYDVLQSSPREISLEMLSPKPYTATLREEGYDVDPDTRNPRVRGGYLGLSASGDVTAPLVYANGGNPEDYKILKEQDIDVRGKIVLVRYSNPYSYRGFKALTAQNQGAAAILIYSDPAEDGFKRGKVFPNGPWGPESHIQRGAVTYDFLVPGDPLTPGWASVAGAKRIPIEQAISVPKIMALAISWHDAEPLLRAIGGPPVPKTWQGGLPFEYHLGGEVARLHLKIDMDNSVKPNFVVEARLRGSRYPDEWVLLGNHRDAWEFGGVDPSSGTASMMELSRVLRKLPRPKRTLIVCSWDGEEVGLTGSTEWGEEFAEDLRKKLVAYINVDSSASGPNFEGSAVASLAPLLVDVSRGLKDPSGKSLLDAWMQSIGRARAEQKDAKPVSEANVVDTRIGSGSDHTVFLNFLGRPVIGLTFDGPYGVYHSVYDDLYWMNHFGDPGYRYHALISRIWGVLALRLGNADVLPFDFGAYGDSIHEFIGELDHYKGHLDLGPALARASEFAAAGRRLKEAIQSHLDSLDPNTAASINRAILDVEANWLNPEGIPGRPWFKHILYAARYTYAHLELPGLTEAIEKSDWPTAKQQARILEAALAKNTALLERAAGHLSH